MIFVVDIGNTSTVCGIFEKDGKLKRIFSFTTEKIISAEELASKIYSFLRLYELEFKNFDYLIISSVVPSVVRWWKELGKAFFKDKVLIVSKEIVPIKVALKYPAEIGSDRLVNAFAGWKKYKTSLIIADFGTAITFDCVLDGGIYIGGAICPGIYISLEALFLRTAKLPEVDLNSPLDSALGKDTESAIKSGILYGFAGLTDRLIEELSKEMKTIPKTIATGGLANIIYPYAKKLEIWDPYLNLEGLYFLWKEVCK